MASKRRAPIEGLGWCLSFLIILHELLNRESNANELRHLEVACALYKSPKWRCPQKYHGTECRNSKRSPFSGCSRKLALEPKQAELLPAVLIPSVTRADLCILSGDFAYYDTDGRVHFVERIKEMIKCLDQQVVPTELEELLLAKHDGIAEVAVLGVPHPVYGEAPAAIVVPKKDIKNVAGAMEREIKDIIAGISNSLFSLKMFNNKLQSIFQMKNVP